MEENTHINTENIDTENIDTENINTENIDTENIDTENIDTENYIIEDYNSMTGNCEHNDDNFDIIQEECEYCEYCDDCEYIREYYNYLPENDDYLRSYQEDENGDYLD
jgi:hypothetical protein